MKLFITGGADQKIKGFFQKKPKAGHGYVLKLDWTDKAVEKQFHYFTPDDKINSHITKELTCGHIYKKEIYVASRTEVLIMDLLDFKIKKKITNPFFHDLHQAKRIEQNIYVVNTGLEMIQCFTLAGRELKQINTSPIPTWNRFDKNIDYRLVESTKPHKVHVNYIFERYPGELWATCLLPKKAVCITDKKKPIKISEGYIHDGHVFEESIFFTTTNGYLVEIDRQTLNKKKTYNLFAEYAEHNGGNLGWCRGVGVTGGRAYVGFSVLRPTKNKEFFDKMLSRKHSLPTIIIEVDLHSGKITDEYVLPYKNCTVFSIMPYAD